MKSRKMTISPVSAVPLSAESWISLGSRSRRARGTRCCLSATISRRPIYYLDETWINPGHTRSKVWEDQSVTSSSDAQKKGLTTGLNTRLEKARGSSLFMRGARRALLWGRPRCSGLPNESTACTYVDAREQSPNIADLMTLAHICCLYNKGCWHQTGPNMSARFNIVIKQIVIRICWYVHFSVRYIRSIYNVE